MSERDEPTDAYARIVLDAARKIGELADVIERSSTRKLSFCRTGVSGLPCAGELQLNAREVATHDCALDEEAALRRDEPPSRPA